jgi:asparagine synthase (glutamine-hydrolysing)
MKLTEPFGDYSSLPSFLLTKIARRENKVMLSGDGGDELFFGYPRFLKTVNTFPWFKYPMPLRRIISGMLRKTGRRVSYAVADWKYIQDWVLEQHCHNSRKYLSDLLPGLQFTDEINTLFDNSNMFNSKKELLYWLRWNEFYGHMQRVLTKVDRTSMGNSLEVRVPFLDKRIIQFSWSINPGLGITHQFPKQILKRALKQKLGNTAIDNKKRGFTIPVRKWLRNELRKDFQAHLLDIPLFGEQYWNKQELEKRIEDFIKNDKGNEWGLWILYAMQKWASQYRLN